MAPIPFPPIKPDIFTIPPFFVDGWQIGPISLRWYAVAYIVGLILGWRYCLVIAKKPPVVARPIDIDDFLVWATLGVVLGGRLGYVLFYNSAQYVSDPIEILYLWHGGMSFHGGAAGVIVAILLFCRLRNIPFLALGDIICCAVPIGLFFGRIANFINDELWGRAAPPDWPGAMLFPSELLTSNKAPAAVQAATQMNPSYGQGDTLLKNTETVIAGYRYDPKIHDLLLSDHYLTPRYPSQLYEALLEGVLLFFVLWILQRNGARQRPGLISGVFLLGYGLARFIVEFFREPDAQLGYLIGDASFGITMGQILSIPLMIVGLWLIFRAKKTVAAPA